MLLYSAMRLRRACVPFHAMTGEITLHGRVRLAIGGVIEKLLAALQEGIKTVLLPVANRPDVEDLQIEELSRSSVATGIAFRRLSKPSFPIKRGA